MTPKFCIGEKRFLVYNKKTATVTILEDKTDKFVRFPLKRWVQFVSCCDLIDDQLKSLETASLQWHIGCGIHVCVSAGIKCVDLRRFYWNATLGQVKPTREGIALRLPEYEKLKEAIAKLHEKCPEAASAQPCLMTHIDQTDLQQCGECNPYHLPVAAPADI
jgi:hypothetical protein